MTQPMVPTPYNATADLLERNLVPRQAERAYLRVADRIWCYQEVAAAADAAAAGLLGLGLSQGDRVLLAARDCPEFVATFWGAIKAGLVIVPIAQGLSRTDIEFLLTDSQARVIVCDAASATAVLPAAAHTGVIPLFIGTAAPTGVLRWSEVCPIGATVAVAATTDEDLALWLYTSGTTGFPKAVMHRHRHLRRVPEALAGQVIQMGPDDIVLSISKMFFAYGLGNSVYLPAAAGASVIVNERPVVPAMVLDLLQRGRPNVLFGVPAFYDGFSRLAEAHLPDTVRMAISAGETLTAELFERFRIRFKLPLLDGLGATEVLHHFLSNRPDDIVPGSAGRPLDGYCIQVLDEHLQPVPDGSRGELWVQGPTTMVGYWRKPELTARAYRDGWMRTGDLVRVVDQHVFHEGRVDDLMKLGGIWVAPVEIEQVLHTHPDITAAAVVAVDTGVGVPMLKAYVVATCKNDELVDELMQFCRQRLASFKVPQAYEIVDELPRTITGKLRRVALRQATSAE